MRRDGRLNNFVNVGVAFQYHSWINAKGEKNLKQRGSGRQNIIGKGMYRGDKKHFVGNV